MQSWVRKAQLGKECRVGLRKAQLGKECRVGLGKHNWVMNAELG